MNPSLSQRSLESLGTSAFSRELIQDQQTLAVVLPKGVRVPLSARAAGAAATRRYDVTVTPGAWPRLPRSQRPAIRPVQEDKEEDEDKDEISEVRDERAAFWKDRARKFQIGSHFPALVSARLIPGWRKSAAKKEAPSEVGPRDRNSLHLRGASMDELGNNLLSGTISMNAKHRLKHEEEMGTPWMGSGLAGASDRICGRTPVIHQGDTYGAPEKKGELQAAKQRWVSNAPILPTGRASEIKRSVEVDLGGSGLIPSECEPEELSREIQQRRAQGEMLKKELQRRYAERRCAFQREGSNFEARGRKQKQVQSDAPSDMQNEDDKGQPRPGLGTFSLAFKG